MKKNQILLHSGRDYFAMTKELLTAADLAGMIRERQAAAGRPLRIGIKPNLVSPTPASFGATTHPEIVDGIIDYLQENGFNQNVILESSWVGDRTSDAYEYCGYRELCERRQVPFWDLQLDQGEKRDCRGMKLQICRRVKEIDFLINVPVLKGHCQTKITCALKNLKGLLPNAEKRRFHSMGLHDPIAHLNAAVRQDFILVDQICGDPGCEDGGNPLQMDRIFAALDPVLADAYVCRVLGYAVHEIPYIVRAQELGVGCADLQQAEIIMLGDNQPEEAFRVEAPHTFVDLQELTWEVDSCSACYASLMPALQRILEEYRSLERPEAEKDSAVKSLEQLFPDKICIGQGWRGKKGKLGIGQCTRLFEESVEGCPPTEDEVYAFLSDAVRERQRKADYLK